MKPNKTHKRFEQFIVLSEILTGFERTDLLATGVCETYYAWLMKQDEPVFEVILKLSSAIIKPKRSREEIEGLFRERIFESPKYGTFARNMVKMWYLGSWLGQVVSADAYKEGLVWPAIGTHPPAAKQPGYASWSLPPDGEARAKGAGP